MAHVEVTPEREPAPGAERARGGNGTPSIGALIANLSRDTTRLVRQEIALARAEMRENVDQMRSAAGALAVGGVFALAGVIVLLMAAVYAIGATALSLWAAALIVGGAAALIGLAVLAGARSKLDPSTLKPERAIEEARKSKNMVKSELGSN